MKNRNFKLLTLSTALAGVLLSGCGGGTSNTIEKQPHNSSKLGRTVSVENDWTWDVGARFDVARGAYFGIDFWAGVPDEVKNYQIFIDMDNDQSTGFSGSDGWEIYGADYLIENQKVYKSISNSEWKWQYIGSFENSVLANIPGLGKYENTYFYKATPGIENIFTKNFKVMMEVYDENWRGDYCTISGIDVEFTGGVSVATVEKEIRDFYNSDTRTIFEVKFSADKKTAIATVMSKSEGKQIYLINTSNIQEHTVIAKEYLENLDLKEHIFVPGDGVIVFYTKENLGAKYRIRYDYKNNKVITKSLVDGQELDLDKIKKELEKGGDNVNMKLDKTNNRIVASLKNSSSTRLYLYDLNYSDLSHKTLLYEEKTYHPRLYDFKFISNNEVSFEYYVVSYGKVSTATVSMDMSSKKVTSCNGKSFICKDILNFDNETH